MTARLHLLGAAAIVAVGALTLPVSTALAESAGSRPSLSNEAFDTGQKYQDGIRFLQQGAYKEAERAFKDVLEVTGRDAGVNYMMAMSQLGLNDMKDARKYLRASVKYNGELAEARGWLGAVEIQMGDAEAGAEQKAALEAQKAKCAAACPKAAAIDEGLARIEAASAKPASELTPQDAVKRLASMDEGDAAYLSAHGLINEGRYADGLAELEMASLAFGPNPDVLTYQGFANRKLGNYQTAIAFYSAALALKPDHRGANEYLGEYYVEIGDMTKARAQLGKLDRICKFGCEEAEELRRWIAAKS